MIDVLCKQDQDLFFIAKHMSTDRLYIMAMEIEVARLTCRKLWPSGQQLKTY
jgi:hypothetical protein